MQVQIANLGTNQATPTALADAWDWLQNTQDGVQLPSENSLQSKLSTAYNLSIDIQADHTNSVSAKPPNLSPCQLEQMALELYGPYPGGLEDTPTSLHKQYYTVKCSGGAGANCTGGSWQWVINTAGNLCGVCYVAKVRNNTPLSMPFGSSPSSCSATDPPTNLASLCKLHGCKIRRVCGT